MTENEIEKLISTVRELWPRWKASAGLLAHWKATLGRMSAPVAEHAIRVHRNSSDRMDPSMSVILELAKAERMDHRPARQAAPGTTEVLRRNWSDRFPDRTGDINAMGEAELHIASAHAHFEDGAALYGPEHDITIERYWEWQLTLAVFSRRDPATIRSVFDPAIMREDFMREREAWLVERRRAWLRDHPPRNVIFALALRAWGLRHDEMRIAEWERQTGRKADELLPNTGSRSVLMGVYGNKHVAEQVESMRAAGATLDLAEFAGAAP